MGHLKNDKRKAVIPLAVFVVVTCLVALVIYPVVSATPQDIGLAIASLDEGAKTPQGEMNIGETIVGEITSATEGDIPVAWTVLEMQTELDAALEAGEHYATLVIPEDFTATGIAAQMGSGEQSKPVIIINQGKNPTIAAQVEMMLGQMLGESGLSVEINYINAVPEDLGTGAIAQQMSYMLTIIITIILTIVLFIVTRVGFGVSKKERAISLGIRLAYAVVLTLGVGWFVSFFMTTFAGIALPFTDTMLFLWLASFALMTLFLGFFSFHFALGVLALITVIVCGLTTALLPYEFLPEFWQNWLYPWVPERFIAEGLAQILYQGTGVSGSATTALIWMAAGGVALMMLSMLVPGKAVRMGDDAETEAVKAP